MKLLIHKEILAVVVLGASALFSPLMAQQMAKVSMGDPKFENLPSPQFSVGKNKSFKPKDWLECEVKFNVEMSRDYKQKFIDRVTVKWYVAIEDPQGGKRSVFLEKEVNHVNVPVGEDIYSSVYLSPAAIKRISGSDRASKRVVKSVGGEILVNGQAAYKGSGIFSSTGKAGWWRQISRYDKIPLRNKNETPFKFLWWDRYAEIEESRR
ncbi:hypothetical protein HW115_11675 [Verrucomicrobiaceae bacterium N1E253]|uniref:Uncharacterized protein n=1 Tax=Oceaniferula marina TaxID=2748318 RepID=A0A851GHB1_9BACT|nr:Amuc_1102 family pilus-like protein [Oceaniferula marina]NWK56272.1 hypothetical protein [Oceaniferula marina]